MSNNDENETEEEKRERTIYIKHEGLPTSKGEGSKNVKELKERLEEREAQLSLIALREFETEKEKLLEMVPEDKKEELSEFVTSPERLETLRKIYPSEEETETRTAPAGKATLGIKTRTDTPSFDVEKGYSDPWIQKISDLYNVIGDPKASAEEKKRANRVLDNLYLEMRKGLKDRRNKGEIDYVYPKKGRYGWTCQACGKANQTNSRPDSGIPCVHCGYKFGVDPVPTHPYA